MHLEDLFTGSQEETREKAAEKDVPSPFPLEAFVSDILTHSSL